MPFVEPGVNSDSTNMRRPRCSDGVLPSGNVGAGPPRAKSSRALDEKNRLSVLWNSATSANCSSVGSSTFCTWSWIASRACLSSEGARRSYMRAESSAGVLIVVGIPPMDTCLHSVPQRFDSATLSVAMTEKAARVRITEEELARDTHEVLNKVRRGIEVVVEQDHRPVAVIIVPHGPGRPIGECIALAKSFETELGYAPTADPDFARDVQAAIDENRQPLTPLAWD